MAVKIIDGDLFQTKALVICHQVNCRGKMGSGVAKQIRALYPLAYERYRLAYNRQKNDPRQLLGCIQFCHCNDEKTETGMRMIINMFAQDRYGYDGECYTDYKAFEYCIRKIHQIVDKGGTIAMPYKIGCGLAGGDWNVVYGMIEKILGPHYTVELWRKEG